MTTSLLNESETIPLSGSPLAMAACGNSVRQCGELGKKREDEKKSNYLGL